MDKITKPARGKIEFSFSEENRRYGAQLAVSCVVAYSIPWALTLPEAFWAVMSALIIVRPRTGATLGEGWNRLKGALTGTLFGLFGVWMHSLGLVTSVTTLAVIAVLAFIAGLSPALRAAPITALIILSSGGIPGHGPWQVAGLRIVEIAIGIAAGLLVSWLTPNARSAAHFDESVAQLLADVGEDARLAMSGQGPTGEEREEASRSMRTRIGRLIKLAESADTEGRFARKNKPDEEEKPGQRCRRQARLLSRIVQDAALFGRIYELTPEEQGSALWPRIAAIVADALLAVVKEGKEEARTALKNLGGCLSGETEAEASARLLQGPVGLLLADLRTFVRLRQV
ncbi:MAG TPA: FUSC family protein [Burkholderiaceae bacterium]